MSVSRQDIEDAEEAAAQTGGGTDATEGLFNMVSISVLWHWLNSFVLVLYFDSCPY